MIKNIIFVICVIIIRNSYTQDISAFINSKRCVNTIDDKFISILVDPVILINELNINPHLLTMTKHLSPAFIRIQGYSTNKLQYSDDQPFVIDSAKNFNPTKLSSSIWTSLNEWLIKANLTPVFALTDQNRVNDVWDPKFLALPLMELSDKINISCYWEIANDSPRKTLQQYADEITVLRNTLDAFPAQKSSWKIAGGDISSCSLKTMSTKIDREVATQLLEKIDTMVDAINWSPKINEINFPTKIKKSNPETFNQIPSIWTTAPRTSNPTNFHDALIWAKYLGQAANFGYNVIFRQPKIKEFHQITPAFWVSLLHKKLMGPKVLHTKTMNFNNKKNCFVFAHSKKTDIQDDKKGITIMVVNLEETEVNVTAKFLVNGLKDIKILNYVLTSTNPDSSDISLNGSPVSSDLLQNTKIEFMPTESRAKQTRSICFKLPSKSIGFFVIPSEYLSPSIQGPGTASLHDVTSEISFNSDDEDQTETEKENESEYKSTGVNNLREIEYKSSNDKMSSAYTPSIISLVNDIMNLITKQEMQDKANASVMQMKQQTNNFKPLLAVSSIPNIMFTNFLVSEAMKSNSPGRAAFHRFLYENHAKQRAFEDSRRKRELVPLENTNKLRDVHASSALVSLDEPKLLQTHSDNSETSTDEKQKLKLETIKKRMLNVIERLGKSKQINNNELLEIKILLQLYHNEIKNILSVMKSNQNKKNNDDFENLAEKNRILTNRRNANKSVDISKITESEMFDLERNLIEKYIQEQKRTSEALENFRSKRDLIKIENKIENFNPYLEDIEKLMIKKYLDRQRRVEENLDIIQKKTEPMKRNIEEMLKPVYQEISRIKRKPVLNVAYADFLQKQEADNWELKKKKRNANNDDSPLDPEEIQMNIMKAEKEAENYKKLINMTIKNLVRNTRSLNDDDLEFENAIYGESSDSVEKTQQDNKTTKFNKRHKRRSSEEDSYLNEISREDDHLAAHYQEDDYLIKAKMNNIGNKNDYYSPTSTSKSTQKDEDDEKFFDSNDYRNTGIVDYVLQSTLEILNNIREKIRDYFYELAIQ